MYNQSNIKDDILANTSTINYTEIKDELKNDIEKNYDILIDIYYNSGELLKTKSINHEKNNYVLEEYIIKYNEKNDTKYNYFKIKDIIDNMKTYQHKLYKSEYTRIGEDKYISEFCNNSHSITEIKNTIIPNKENEYSLLSYNIHGFINQCSYKTKDKTFDIRTINSRNNKEVIDFVNTISPDILFFQEYTPYYIEHEANLKLYNFVTDFNETYKDNIYPYYTSSICTPPKDKYTYFGNFLMSRYNIYDIVYHKYSGSNEDRCFIESKIEINGINIIVVNIHPDSEVNAKFINYNEAHLLHLFNLIANKYDINNIPIIIAGDYNTNNADIHKKISNLGFMSVYNIYNNINNYTFTGYHSVIIDYIYVSRYFLNIFKITEVKIFNLDISDHYPLLFKFKIKENYFIEDLDLNLVLRKSYISWDKLTNGNIDLTVIRKCIIDLKKFMKDYNYEDILYIPEGTFLAHGTHRINTNSDTPFELTTGTSYIAKSFTLLNNPGESFMSWYGTNDGISLKRLIIYKVKRKIPILNLMKTEHTMHNKLKKRFIFYQKLYKYYNLLYPDYFKDIDEINLDVDPINFEIMFLLQILLNNTLFNHINEDTALYNKELFYGTIMIDLIQNDTTLHKLNLSHNKIINYWKGVEMYEGMEVQLFATDYFIELDSIYYNNKFYTLDEWKSIYKTYIDIINANKKLYNPIDFRNSKYHPNDIQKYNIIIDNILIYQKFIVNLFSNNNYYSDTLNKKYNDMFSKLININSWLNMDKDNMIFLNLVNDFICNLLNLFSIFDNLNKIFPEHMKSIDKIDFNTFTVFENTIYYTNTLEQYKLYIFNLFTNIHGSHTYDIKFFYLIIVIALDIFKQSRTTDEPLLIIFNYLLKNINTYTTSILNKYTLSIEINFINYIKSKSTLYNKKYLKYKKKYIELKNFINNK